MRSHVKLVSLRGRDLALYEVALRRAGFDVTSLDAVIEVTDASDTLTIKASDLDPVRVLGSTTPEDVARIVELVADTRDLARRVQALERSGAMGLVAGILAHDANNAIMFIQAAVEEISRTALTVDSDLLADLLHASLRLAGILRRLHSLQKVDADQEPVQVGARVFALLPVLRSLAGKSRRVTVDVEEGLPEVQMDPSDLERSLINVVANARDATPSGGEIAVRVHLVLLSAPSSAIPAGAWVVLSVRDHGTGMDPATLERATKAFFTTKRVGRGTGLGLVSVASAMHVSRGHLRIESTLGKGTTVELWLPALVG